MKIALMNGSPKKDSQSASKSLLLNLKSLLHQEDTIYEIHLARNDSALNAMEQIKECDALVFSFPLYVDGLPSHLIDNLCYLETFYKQQMKRPDIYVLINCGFYEGVQNDVAMASMQKWTKKIHATWGMGIGVGGGGMLTFLVNVPLGKGPKKSLGEAYHQMVDVMYGKQEKGHCCYLQVNFPRFAYKMAAQYGWRKLIKMNGGKRKDLGQKR